MGATLDRAIKGRSDARLQERKDSCVQSYKDSCMLAINPLPDMPSDNRPMNFRLSSDLVQALRQEAMEEGLTVVKGRAYNPSAIVERILRAYFDAKRNRDKSAGR